MRNWEEKRYRQTDTARQREREKWWKRSDDFTDIEFNSFQFFEKTSDVIQVSAIKKKVGIDSIAFCYCMWEKCSQTGNLISVDVQLIGESNLLTELFDTMVILLDFLEMENLFKIVENCDEEHDA